MIYRGRKMARVKLQVFRCLEHCIARVRQIENRFVVLFPVINHCVSRIERISCGYLSIVTGKLPRDSSSAIRVELEFEVFFAGIKFYVTQRRIGFMLFWNIPTDNECMQRDPAAQSVQLRRSGSPMSDLRSCPFLSWQVSAGGVGGRLDLFGYLPGERCALVEKSREAI